MASINSNTGSGGGGGDKSGKDDPNGKGGECCYT